MGGTKSGIFSSNSTTVSWSVLQERVYRTKILDVGKLKRRIKNEWVDLIHAIIECVVGECASA